MAMLLLFLVIGVAVSEVSLRLIPTREPAVRTMTRFFAVGSALVGGVFRLDVMHTGDPVRDLFAAAGISLAVVLFLRMAHGLIVRGGYRPDERKV